MRTYLVLFHSSWLFLFFATASLAQSEALADNTLYQNVVKYYAQVEEFLEAGDRSNAQKRVQYANRFLQKLQKMGFEEELEDYSQKIMRLQERLAAPTATQEPNSVQHNGNPTTNNGPTMDRNEWRSAVNDLLKLEPQIRSLFNFSPAYAQLNDNYLQPIHTIKKEDPLSKIEQLRQQAQAQQAYHRSYLQQLDRLATTLSDLEAALKASNFEQNLSNTFQLIANSEDREAEFPIQNTRKYLEQLEQLLPNSPTLQRMRAQLQTSIGQQKAYHQAQNTVGKATQADRSLPVRGLRDATLERTFQQLARPHVPSQYKIVDVIITSQKWGVNKDNVGRPLHRDMLAYMVEQDPNGQCYVQYFSYTQPAVGGGYGKTQIDLDWSGKSRREVECP